MSVYIALSPKKITVGDEGEIRAIETGNTTLCIIFVHIYKYAVWDCCRLVDQGRQSEKKALLCVNGKRSQLL